MKRLVIKHGDQILRHELGERPATVGRDPSCELSFDDPSLSRKHGTFASTPGGVRYVDLGSRNGSWVNFKRTKQADLSPGDTVRIGALLITYSADPPEPPPLPASPPEPKEDPADATATVIAPSVSVVKKEPKAAPEPEPKPEPEPPADKTVLLNRDKAAPPSAPTPSAGTMLLRAEDVAPKLPADTARLTADRLAPPRPAPPAPSAPPGVFPAPSGPPAADVAPPPERWSWTARHAFLTLGVGLVLYLVLALPLTRTLGNALREESLRRGRALLDVLASANGAAMAEGRTRDLDVEKVTREERIKEALLLDLQGKVLAPTSRVDETLATIEGIDPPTEEIRTFYLGRRGGDYVMVEPVIDRGKRVGIAVIVYEVATASGSWAVAVMFLAFLILLLGVLVAIVLGKRLTLEPIGALGDDVEAVVKGDAPRVPLAQGFSELSELAKTINRLIDRSPVLSRPAGAAAVGGYPPAPHRPSTRTPAMPVPATPVSRSTPPSPPAVRTQSSVPSTNEGTPVPAPPQTPATGSTGAGDVARFWADAGFIVMRVEPAAASLLGSTPQAMEGHHVIEAIRDQRLLGIVLDSLNGLESGAASETPAVAELPDGPVTVTAAREGDSVVVSLKRPG